MFVDRWCPTYNWKLYNQKQCYGIAYANETRTYRTFTECKKSCKIFGGKLAAIQNKEENDFISKYV